MFSRKSKETLIVNFEHADGGSSLTTTSTELSGDRLIKYLKEKHTRYGELVIENIFEGEVYVTTKQTKLNDEMDTRLEKIKGVVQGYVKGEAVEMTAHAVYVNGELKGVFGEEVMSRFKKSSLMREGISKEDITIEEIKINSYKDIN